MSHRAASAHDNSGSENRHRELPVPVHFYEEPLTENFGPRIVAASSWIGLDGRCLGDGDIVAPQIQSANRAREQELLDTMEQAGFANQSRPFNEQPVKAGPIRRRTGH